jgi:hypothetical protein
LPPNANLDQLEETLAPYSQALTLLEVWRRWRGDRLVPSQSDLRPEQFGTAIRRISVLHWQARDRVIVHLAQSFLEDLAKQQFSGLKLVDLAPPEQRETRMDRFWQITHLPCGMLASSTAVLRNDVAVEYITLNLPFSREPGGEPLQIFSCLDWVGSYNLHEIQQQVSGPVAQEVTFIDIGAGLPATAS